MNIGIDFGSTYTIVSKFRKNTNQLESLSLSEASPYIPSVVSYYKEQYLFANAAKGVAGKKQSQTFKAFKMLLSEKDVKKMEQRGFSSENTPLKITRIFLKYLLEQTLQDQNEMEIEELVIGVPEIWFESLEQMSGRSILKQICDDFSFVKNVQIVSEPTAASAFFAYNYECNTGKPFDGNILLIDYGGGTLDITLSQVMRKQSGNGVEIKILDRQGVGENTEGEIGNAGIIYMETVIREALIENKILKLGEEVNRDGKFYKVVDELERDLQDRTIEIKKVFVTYGEDMSVLRKKEFTDLEYRGEDITITYATLLQVYNRVIYPVLKQKVEKIISSMEKMGIGYMDDENDKFKVAVVGGFGNFYLVQKQIADIFDLKKEDRRQKDIIVKREECEKSIAYGTALLAEKKIGIRNTAPYSIAIYTEDELGVQYYYAFYYGQDIEFDAVYFPISKVDGKPYIIMLGENRIDSFLINLTHDERKAVRLTLRKGMQLKLQNLLTNQCLMAAIGFSLNASHILSIHIREYDIFEGKINDEDNKIELASIGDIFEYDDLQKIMVTID